MRLLIGGIGSTDFWKSRDTPTIRTKSAEAIHILILGVLKITVKAA
jgi:hypothetical protein